MQYCYTHKYQIQTRNAKKCLNTANCQTLQYINGDSSANIFKCKYCHRCEFNVVTEKKKLENTKFSVALLWAKDRTFELLDKVAAFLSNRQEITFGADII